MGRGKWKRSRGMERENWLEKVGMWVARVEEEEGNWAGGPLCLCSPQLSAAKCTAASLSDFSQLNFRAKTSLLRICLRAQCRFLLPKGVGLLGFSLSTSSSSSSLSVDAVCDWLCLTVFLGLCVSGAADWGKNSFSVYEKNPPHTREHFTPPPPPTQCTPVWPGLN